MDGWSEKETTSAGSDQERIAWLRLKLTPALGNRSLLRLLERCGSPAEILRLRGKDLGDIPFLRERARTALQRGETLRSPEAEWEQLQQAGIRLMCLPDADYPANLKAIPDPPAVLFAKGTLEARDLVAISVVGSRAASPMGIAFTERLCMDLVQYGVTIVSGLAVGIDSAAHRGALRGKGRTLAVLGCGLDVEYPRSNTELRRQIVDSGALFSEFLLGVLPAPDHFPMRNRIISGLALGVVVVEAANRSGSLITARLALEQGREVFAVPGMARNYRSVGPHRLLRQGAKLVESAEDVLEEIRPLLRTSTTVPLEQKTIRNVQLEPDEMTILSLLDQTPKHIDIVCRELRWPVEKVLATLLNLELKGAIRQLPGKLFIAAD